MSKGTIKKTEGFDLQASTDKWRWAGLILMGMFFLAFPLFRLYEPAQRADAREAQVGYLAAEGMDLYETNCAECHGPEGSGAVAPAVGAKEFLEAADDIQITQLIALGVPGTEMIAYSNDLGGPLTSQEIRAISTYLRSLEEEAPSKPNWRTPLADENLSGQEIFVLACSRCHGVDAGGMENLGPDISQDSFTMMESDEFIFGRIIEGYKLMPRFGNILTDEQVAMVVAYLRFGDNPPPDTTTTTTTTPGNGNGNGNQGSSTTTTEPEGPATDPEVLALGERLYQEIAGGGGCQECHGRDGTGTVNAPYILDAGRSAIMRGLNGGIPDMDFQPRLTNEEVDAVYLYLHEVLRAEARADG